LLIILKSLIGVYLRQSAFKKFFAPNSLFHLTVILVKTGIQDKNKIWIPASAGMTTFLIALFHIFFKAVN